ncbi:unnamed protein product [Linum trigynum]|uniref:Uncharacterized protein n=1 Tax=Linum trigynum TaxID=586398 RepID=A0AAV2ESU7_9ROSI
MTTEGKPIKPCAQLFGIVEENRLCYVKPEVVSGGLRIPKEVRDGGAAKCKLYLVDQFLQSPPALLVIRLWEKLNLGA